MKKRILKDNKQKIIVAVSGDNIEYKVLYTEKVPNVNAAKARVKELKEKYKDNKGLSVHYFSV